MCRTRFSEYRANHFFWWGEERRAFAKLLHFAIAMSRTGISQGFVVTGEYVHLGFSIYLKIKCIWSKVYNEPAI